MRKTMILAALAALISLASCQKEEAINNGTDKNASPVFTASIAGATKTTIDMTDGNVAKIAWETTDEITVTDRASASAIYEIESIDATTGRATFVLKTGETALGDGPYTATYGTEPATAQTYSATAGKLYMTAPSTSNNSFTFTVQCGLMKLNLTKTGESVKSIAVTGTPTGGSETTYTLTCTEAQSIATAKDFFIALPDGSYKKIEISNASDIKCTLNSASGVEVAANHIKPVTFDESKLNFPITTGKAMRTGNIEVNWVQLWAGGPKFAEYNIGVTDGKAESYGGYYTWGGSYNNDLNLEGHEWTTDGNSGTVALSGDNDTATKLWGENWRMPTSEELAALLNDDNCTCTWINDYHGTVGCLFTGKEGTAYASNSVFLPAAGSIDQRTKKFSNVGEDCQYWSATPTNIGVNRLQCAKGESTRYVNRAANYKQPCSVRAVFAK